MKKSGSVKRIQMRTNLSVKKFDTDFTRKFFESECKRIFQAAAIEFVQMAAAHVPTLTGQARAALINIAKSIGVDPGVGLFDPPISQYENQLIGLVLAGNTPARGKTLGRSEIINNAKSVTWTIYLDVTAAHNGFEYFTYWDNTTWHSMDEARKSALRYIDNHFTDVVAVRVK